MSSAPAPSSRPCPVCRASVADARCEECGAALAPGGYRVERLISQSPRGRLYLARDEHGGKVAVKELVFASVPSVEEVAAFEREAKTLSQLDHPRIPRLVRFFEEGRGVNLRFYLVQTFIEGSSLLQALSQRRYSEKEALHVARQVLDILRYLHGLSPRVLHRDIKPANLIEQKDALYLVDFDCARDLAKGVTHQATLVGTFGYCPPEQLGGTASPSSDLYALGATLVHLLSRKAPADLLGPGMRLEFSDAVNVSGRTREFLGRLLHADPARRYQSAEEALQALDGAELAPVTGSKKQPAPPAVAADDTIHAPGPMLLALSLGLGVILLVILWVALRFERPPEQTPTAASPSQQSAPPSEDSLPPGWTRNTDPIEPPPAPVIPVTAAPAKPAEPAEFVGILEGVDAPLDHDFPSMGLQLLARSVEAGPNGKRVSGKPALVRMLLQVRVPKTEQLPGSYQRMAWHGVDYQWRQYVTVLASGKACVRCETLKPGRAWARLEDGTQQVATTDRPGLLIDHRDKLTVDSLVELSLDFDVHARQFPIALLFQDGHVQMLPWVF